MNKVKELFKSFKNIFTSETADMLIKEANSRGWKTKCVAYSYIWFTRLTCMIMLGSLVLLIVAGIHKDFQLYVDILRDIVLGLFKYIFYFFVVAILATFGVTYLDGKFEVKEPMKDEEKKEEINK